jgi:hypothetical protein
MDGWRRAGGALLFSLFLPACGGTPPPVAREAHATPAAAPPCPLPAGDPLCAVNDAFHDAYAARRAAMLATSGPVLLQLGDRLVLVRGKERVEALTTNARYHELKSVAHVPFAVFLMLAPGDGPIDEARIRKLDAYRALVRRAAATLDRRFAGGAQRDRQRRIFDRSIALLDKAIGAKRVEAAALRDFAQVQRADLLENAKEAAREQVTIMHALVTAWTSRMSAAERSRVKVVVGTVHMARPGNLAVQYFQAWLGEPYAGRLADERVGEAERIVVAEGVFDADRSLALLGTHLVDRAAARAFFDDVLRLDRDLLSDGAEEAVRELLGRTPDQGAERGASR